MKSCVVLFVGLLLSVSVSAEPLLEGRVRLESGAPAAGVQVRLFDLTNLHQSVSTTTDQTGHFILSLPAFAPGPALPQGFALGQNYPNPFNPSTSIPYQIPTTAHVRLEVFNLLGQRIATLVDAEQAAGAHTATWTATDKTGRAVGAGVYIYRLVSGGASVSKRMVLVDGQAGMPAAGAAGPLPASALGRVEADASVYGLTVAGEGVVAYVNPAFRVGVDEVEIVLEAASGIPRMKLAAGGILGDVNNDGQVDAYDVLYVALYSEDSSITLPNNGDITLGDINGDGTVNRADALLLAAYLVDPSDPSLPAGIGQTSGGDTTNVSYVREGSSIRITWDAVSGAEYYKIYHDDFFRNQCRLDSWGRPSFCDELASNIQATSYVHTSPDDDNNYYWVVACNSGGCSTIDSENPATFIDTRPGAPTNVSYVREGSSIRITWDAVSGAEYYKIYHDDLFGGTRTVLSFQDGGLIELQDGTIYTCTDAGGCSIEKRYVTKGTFVSGSGGKTYTVGDALPNFPSGFFIPARLDNVSISTGDSCRLDSGGRPSFCDELASNIQATSYVHTSPDDDNNYYWVVACNSDGCSDIDSKNPAVSQSQN